jgi:anaerobic selenocysteine-containing dehydrogenase
MTDWVARAALAEGRWRIASPTLMSRLKALIDAFRRDQGDLMLVSRRQTQHTSSTQHIRSERRYDRPTLLISPDDAAALGIEDGSDVEVTSAAGSVQAAAEISTDIRHGVVSLPHGWIAANVARLVSGRKGAIDPMTGQPQMSGIPVAVRAMSSWPANAPRKSA